MPGLFITGTDTGIGKTIITCGLALSFIDKGIDIGFMKPIESGCDPSPQDTTFCQKMLNLHEPLDDICPCQLKYPLAPLIASQMEGQKNISLSLIMEKYHHALHQKDLLLVEGAGGLLVPIQPDFYMADLSIAMKTPLLLVVGNTLGAVNHTLLSIQYAINCGLNIIAIVINTLTAEQELATQSNVILLKQLIKDIFLFEIPFIENIYDRESYIKYFSELTDFLSKHFILKLF